MMPAAKDSSHTVLSALLLLNSQQNWAFPALWVCELVILPLQTCMAWLLGCVPMRLLLAFLAHNEIVIFVIKHVAPRCWISQAVYLPPTAQVLLVLSLFKSDTLLLIIVSFFIAAIDKMLRIALLCIALKQKLPEHSFVYFLLNTLLVRPDRRFIEKLDVLVFRWLVRIDHLDLALTEALIRYSVAQV